MVIREALEFDEPVEAAEDVLDVVDVDLDAVGRREGRVVRVREEAVAELEDRVERVRRDWPLSLGILVASLEAGARVRLEADPMHAAAWAVSAFGQLGNGR